ncbi:MAG: hypothetical protein KBT88_12255 [Gammaproteobacteria bacterium]|nr:hypothetical protein [Gammaproteobacteria bacterium]MBQ0840548.1 hypothetical protein [Gammaproteobacteria bacterium]
MNTRTSEIVVLQTDKRKILLATLLALLVAAVILGVFILPAEFNRDPLGVGEALGISGLSQPVAASGETVRKEEGGFHQQSVSFELLPFEFVEYKYQLSKGSSMLYHWTVTKNPAGISSPVSFDFHGESHEIEGYEESYSLGEGDHENGTFIAPFDGIHGWFWANHGAQAVTVTLSTTGFYTESLEFRDGFVKKQMLQ